MIIIILLFIFASAYIDYEHLRDNDYIESHVSRFALRALFILAVSAGDFIVMAGMSLLFMALFDGVLNYLTKMPLLYLGCTARWDRFFREHKFLYILVKIVSLFGGVYLLLL
jgi:hypothetical protein